MTNFHLARTRRPVPILTLAVMAAMGIVGLSGCALVDEFASHQRERVFATVADAPSADTTDDQGTPTPEADALFAPPAFVPTDATDVKIRVITNGPGDILRFTSASPIVDQLCDPGTLVGSPMLESTWWPAEVPTEGIVCESGWQVFQLDGHTYAWASV